MPLDDIVTDGFNDDSLVIEFPELTGGFPFSAQPTNQQDEQ